MTTDYAAIALHSVTSIFGLCLVFVWLIRDHRIDVLRQSLFDLRAELFDYAESGHIPFDHRAYGLLRIRMNRLIQFAHRFTSVELLLLVMFPPKSRDVEPLRQWQEALTTVESSEVREALAAFNDRMMSTLIWHLACSPLVICSTPFCLAFLILKGRVKVSVGRKRLQEHALPVAEKMEEQAFALDADACSVAA
jgi:hypothetical protein